MNTSTEHGREYLEYWIDALKHLLGWSRERAFQWAQQFESELNDESSLLTREYPMIYMTHWLVSENVNCLADVHDRMLVARRLETALLPYCTGEALASYDWPSAIKRIDAILREYDLSLSTIRQRYQTNS